MWQLAVRWFIVWTWHNLEMNFIILVGILSFSSFIQDGLERPKGLSARFSKIGQTHPKRMVGIQKRYAKNDLTKMWSQTSYDLWFCDLSRKVISGDIFVNRVTFLQTLWTFQECMFQLPGPSGSTDPFLYHRPRGFVGRHSYHRCEIRSQGVEQFKGNFTDQVERMIWNEICIIKYQIQWKFSICHKED